MSNLVTLSTSELPSNTHDPPYVVFAIWGVQVSDQLPPLIPLKKVLHFLPQLEQRIVPEPPRRSFSKALTHLRLLKPCVRIDIRCENVSTCGLNWIMTKILQVFGDCSSKTAFLPPPSLLASVTIYTTWLALGLPISGVTNLVTHIRSQLLIGRPALAQDMDAIWAVFQADSNMLREMGINSISSHVNSRYTSVEALAISAWYEKTDGRRRFFLWLQRIIPDVHVLLDAPDVDFGNNGLATETTELPAQTKEQDTVAKVAYVLEKQGTIKVSLRQRRERYDQDYLAMQSRLKRTRSDDSIRSVETAIWNPLEKEKTPVVEPPVASEAGKSNAPTTLAENEHVETPSLAILAHPKQTDGPKAATHQHKEGTSGPLPVVPIETTTVITTTPPDATPPSNPDANSKLEPPLPKRSEALEALKPRKSAALPEQSEYGNLELTKRGAEARRSTYPELSSTHSVVGRSRSTPLVDEPVARDIEDSGNGEQVEQSSPTMGRNSG